MARIEDIGMLEYDMDDAKSNFMRISLFEIPSELKISYVGKHVVLITYHGYDKILSSYKPFLTKKVKFNGKTVCSKKGFILIEPVFAMRTDNDTYVLYGNASQSAHKEFKNALGEGGYLQGYILYSDDGELYAQVETRRRLHLSQGYTKPNVEKRAPDKLSTEKITENVFLERPKHNGRMRSTHTNPIDCDDFIVRAKLTPIEDPGSFRFKPCQ